MARSEWQGFRRETFTKEYFYAVGLVEDIAEWIPGYGSPYAAKEKECMNANELRRGKN